MSRRTHDFQSIRSEGGLLPSDLLRRILDPREKLTGTNPEDYGLPPGERLNEVITQGWNRLRRHWSEFRASARLLPEGEAATGLTNDKWSLPLLRELGFGVLTTSAAPEIEGRTYAISRFVGATPVHLVGCGLSLDRRTAGARGAAVANPHGLVQEFLNRSQGHLWGIVANGLRFRILRDSQALSRQSYLEFDLETMFDGELYADFVLVWLVAHATRFVPRAGGRAESCWLEEWTKLAEEHGTRALGDLRQGVEQALQILGQGIVGHPRNTVLREALRSGQLPLNVFHGQLLRAIYRLIFLFVAEDRTLEGRSLLHAPDDSEAARVARERYATHYSTGRLRELASRLKGSRHGDLYQQFHLIVGAVSTDDRFAPVRQFLALPVLGGFLWDPNSTTALNPTSLTGGDGAELANADFLEVIRHLAFTRQGKMLRPVDYKNLGSEELGGVYESLLALTPQISGDGARFTFAEFAGNERKTSGSYYTPDCLVQCLLDSALDPVVEAAIAGDSPPHPRPGSLDSPVPTALFSLAAQAKTGTGVQRDASLCPGVPGAGSPRSSSPANNPPFSLAAQAKRGMGVQRDASLCTGVPGAGGPLPPSTPEQRILALKICDPACGSGHFLVGAAHRLARHLARVRTLAQGESEPSPSLYQRALRDIIGQCLYGVDINPMAVELCRVSLWLEAMEPGKPLSFLDHHIQCGNSLLGTTPELIEQGLPDDAFKAIAGDDKKACAELKKRNKAECKEIGELFVAEDVAAVAAVRSAALAVDAMSDETPEAVQRKADAFATTQTRYDYLHAKCLADTWCAAFVIPKYFPPTPADPRFLSSDPFGITQRHIMDLAQKRSLSTELARETERLAEHYQFFHWHLAFPDVFAKGGFDCVLGNPPWERVKLQEKEWFAERSPEIANAPNAAVRKRLITELATENPAMLESFAEAQRRAEGESHLLRNSGRYPLCGRGDINVYTVFAESMRTLLVDSGRAGIIVPSGIATDDTTKFFFQDLMDTAALASLFDFENKNIFPEVDSRMKFSLLTLRAANGGQAGSSRQLSHAPGADFVFFAHAVEDIADPDRRFTLSAADIALLNPNTRTCPIFRSRADAELTKAIYRRVPILIRENDEKETNDERRLANNGNQPTADDSSNNPWGIKFSRMFDMSNDSHLFRTREQLEADGYALEGNVFSRHRANGEPPVEKFLPLYEGKFGHQFTHRFVSNTNFGMIELSIEQRKNPFHYVQPQYWVSDEESDEQLSWRDCTCKTGLLGFRRVSCNTNERTCVSAIIPWGAASYGWILSFGPDSINLQNLCSIYNSYAFDYLLRNSQSAKYSSRNI